MQEQLDPDDARLTLLGDRGTRKRAVTEEAWRVVHACVQWVIHSTRCASHDAKGGARDHLRATAMMRAVRKKLQELVSARWRAALRERRTGEFTANWIDTGACLRLRDGSVRACVLSRVARTGTAAVRSAIEPDRAASVHIFTDGGWNPDEGQFEAGWGVAEFELVTRGNPDEEVYDMRQAGTVDPRDRPNVWGRLRHIRGGPVLEGKSNPPMYLGARKQSNNTAELSALYYALHRAAQRSSDEPPEDIHTDSLYARNVTLGLWRGKRGVHATMIRNLRCLWMRVQAKRGRGAIRILHVRSHIDVPGNEMADAIATRAMHNANEVKKILPPGGRHHLLPIGMAWARAQMRAITGSDRLRPPPSTPSSTPSSTSYSHPRTGDG